MEWGGLLKGMEGKKWFKRDNLLIVVLVGILFFIIALPIEENENKKAQSGELVKQQEAVLEEMEGDTSFYQGKEWEYAAYLEERLEQTLSGMEGAGKVKVMITLQASEELVVEKDEPVSRSNTSESDSAGGSRVVTEMESAETTVYHTVGDESEPYVVKTILPQVEGIVVLAQGAGSGSVNANITELVQALFGVDAHKIKVAKLEDTK